MVRVSSACHVENTCYIGTSVMMSCLYHTHYLRSLLQCAARHILHNFSERSHGGDTCCDLMRPHDWLLTCRSRFSWRNGCNYTLLVQNMVGSYLVTVKIGQNGQALGNFYKSKQCGRQIVPRSCICFGKSSIAI